VQALVVGVHADFKCSVRARVIAIGAVEIAAALEATDESVVDVLGLIRAGGDAILEADGISGEAVIKALEDLGAVDAIVGDAGPRLAFYELESAIFAGTLAALPAYAVRTALLVFAHVRRCELRAIRDLLIADLECRATPGEFVAIAADSSAAVCAADNVLAGWDAAGSFEA